MQAFPPAERDRSYQQRFEPLGLFAARAAVHDARRRAAPRCAWLASGKQRMEDTLTHGPSREQNGWKLTYHIFDYNLDFFEVGALDDDAMEARPTAPRATSSARSRRAAACGATMATRPPTRWSTSTATASSWTAAGAMRCASRPPPPVGAFWSVTMYDMPDFYLVDNPIDRYSIGDRTPGMVDRR